MTEAQRPLILRPGEGRSIDMGNFRMSVKASSEDTGGAFTLLEADEPPGFSPPMHIHRDAAEAFYVVAGEYAGGDGRVFRRARRALRNRHGS